MNEKPGTFSLLAVESFAATRRQSKISILLSFLTRNKYFTSQLMRERFDDPRMPHHDYLYFTLPSNVYIELVAHIVALYYQDESFHVLYDVENMGSVHHTKLSIHFHQKDLNIPHKIGLSRIFYRVAS
ncbi:hypothetical protein RF11_08692 [Thelohanellus kitauei]|uniref:Uncharacterized protein n=1 Tax=Thelohanellus kitauei TaxID=669202 RepID=A0A0C2N3W8_THEKT|nr:hypothetical protein RF11_08692 [Thelohanellus kitauei]